jgi:hypothetical protein
MVNIPTEGSTAGEVLAAVLIVGPSVAILLASLIRPRQAAFPVALTVSGALIGSGVWYALHAAPERGTWIGAAVFGGSALTLSIGLAGAMVGLRALAARRGQDG